VTLAAIPAGLLVLAGDGQVPEHIHFKLRAQVVQRQ
jgi:hypothetical protein